MKELVLITNGFGALMSLIALVFLIWGVVILISGKCRLRGNLLKGKLARTIGFVFIVAPICAFALWGIMYESFGWGSYGQYPRENLIKNITSSLIEGVLFFLGIISAYLWARSKARAYKQSENNQ